MTLGLDTFKSLLRRTKSSPSGWLSFNAPCCHHRGHGKDTRRRAGVMFTEGFTYNCFNCKFSASWQPGRPFNEKLKTLSYWLGASDTHVKQLVFEALKTERLDYEPETYIEKPIFHAKELPEAAMSIFNWLESEFYKEVSKDLDPVVEYVITRGFNSLSNDFYWSPSHGFIDRVIIPFRYDSKIVGYTARKITKGKPKYISDQHPFFEFNIYRHFEDNKYVFFCEGPFDELDVDGIALLTNEINEKQASIINSLKKEVIVIPDKIRQV